MVITIAFVEIILGMQLWLDEQLFEVLFVRNRMWSLNYAPKSVSE